MRHHWHQLIVAVLIGWLALPVAAADTQHGVEGPGWFKQSFLDLREDLAEATRAKRKLMLYFYMEGCPYCARFQRETLGVPSITDRTFRMFDVVAIDVRGSREVTDLTGTIRPEAEFSGALGAKFTPSFIVFDRTGQIILRLKGFQEPARFNAALEYVESGAYRQYPDFAVYLKTREAKGMIKGEQPGMAN